MHVYIFVAWKPNAQLNTDGGSITLVSGGQNRFSSDALVGTQQCTTGDGKLRQCVCPVTLQHLTAVFPKDYAVSQMLLLHPYAVRLDERMRIRARTHSPSSSIHLHC